MVPIAVFAGGVVAAWIAHAEPGTMDSEVSPELLDVFEDVVREERGLDVVPGEPPPVKSDVLLDTRISQLDARRWWISVSLRDVYARDIGLLADLARPQPVRGSSGTIEGWRLHLARDSLAHQAGFRSGDVVHAVNGRRLRDWPSVLRVYLQLRHKNDLFVDLTRKNGRTFRLFYEIR